MKVYLATPYSHKDPNVMVQRFETVNRVAAALLASGINVYSPISHTHPIAMAAPDMPNTWAFWEQFDKEFLEWADELHVLMADGWLESIGVQAEIELARAMGKTIKFLHVDDYGYLDVLPGEVRSEEKSVFGQIS